MTRQSFQKILAGWSESGFSTLAVPENIIHISMFSMEFAKLMLE